MAHKPMLRGEVGCACVAREVSAEILGGFKQQKQGLRAPMHKKMPPPQHFQRDLPAAADGGSLATESPGQFGIIIARTAGSPACAPESGVQLQS